MKLLLYSFSLIFFTQCIAQKNDNQYSIDKDEYIKIKQILIKRDTIIDNNKLIEFTRYQTLNDLVNPIILDSLSGSIYKLNQDKDYLKAIEQSKELLKLCPNNLTAHKEISLAYSKSGNENLSKEHFNMMVKIIYSIMDLSDGSYEKPFIVNNRFEGVSIYEAAYRCRPKNQVLMLDKTQRLLGAFKGYSSAYDEIFIKYTDLTHMKKLLTEDDYVIEK